MIQLPGVDSASDPAHLSDKDAALAVVSDVAQEIDPVVGKRVLRKIDRYFMPAMLIGKLGIDFSNIIRGLMKFGSGYGMVYYDKVSFCCHDPRPKYEIHTDISTRQF